MSSELAIQVENLSKCYHIYERPRDRLIQMLRRKKLFREFWALRDVSFSIERGETIGIIGRNGSGKSTLLQMICGTVSPTAGRIATEGRVAALLELGAGFNPDFTGRENVLLNAVILGFSEETMQERMADVLAFSEIGEFLDQPVKTYSSGMYARLAFSIAIHVDPDILIVDETLAVGDSRFVAKCMRRIKEIQQKGATILFVSHDVGVVRTICNRAIWLDKGLMVADGDVFPVTGKYMEFLFQDESSKSNTPLENDIVQKQPPPAGASAAPIEEGNTDILPINQEYNDFSVASSDYNLDARPVTHWGSNKGIILSASVCDEQGNRIDVHRWGKLLEVVVDVCVPLDISRDHLSVAFSIKDLKGTDLIVSTTHDLYKMRLPDQKRFKIVFQMINQLVTGQYLLVAAVENRQHLDIHYYEYVEGAHYFSSLSDHRFFGVFQPKVRQSVRVS